MRVLIKYSNQCPFSVRIVELQTTLFSWRVVVILPNVGTFDGIWMVVVIFPNVGTFDGIWMVVRVLLHDGGGVRI